MPIPSKAIKWETDPKSGNDFIQLPQIATVSLETAAAANEGGIVYDSTTNSMKYSNGSSWQEIGAVLSATSVGTLARTGAETSAKVANYVTAGGANNALTVTASALTLAAGLELFVNTAAYTLQAGANTLALNGGAAKDIKSHNAVANNIGTAYTAASIVHLIYDGTQWQDMSQ